MLGQQGLDLVPIRIQQTGTRRRWACRRLRQLQGRGYGVSRAVQESRDRPAGEFVDLREAADLGPQGDVHGVLLLGSGGGAGASVIWRNRSPSRINPWPGSGRRLTPGAGSDNTWTNGN